MKALKRMVVLFVVLASVGGVIAGCSRSDQKMATDFDSRQASKVEPTSERSSDSADSTNIAQIRELQEERVNALQRSVELAMARYQSGSADFRDVLVTQLELLNAHLEMADSRDAKRKALTSQLEVAKRMLAVTESRFQSGAGTELDFLQAKSAVLRIEIKLLKLT